jgi:two-component system response regulator FixJ
VTETAPTVYVVDDDPSVRSALENLISSHGLRVETFPAAQEFLRSCPENAAGCLVLDVQMPGLSGLDLQRELKEAGIHLPVIFITGHGDIPTTVRAMKAGAADFIEKPFGDERLLMAIGAALASAGQVVRDHEAAEAAQRIGMLSPRERQVLEGLVAGRPNKVIAHDLGISVRTVEVHRARMLERLRIRRASEAIRLAVMATLVPPT